MPCFVPQVAPTSSPGISMVEGGSIRLCCFQTLTGIKFVATAQAGTVAVDAFLQQIYQGFTDYVLKNPFYDIDQPIHCELFTRHVTSLIASLTARR